MRINYVLAGLSFSLEPVIKQCGNFSRYSLDGDVCRALRFYAEWCIVYTITISGPSISVYTELHMRV